MSDPIDTSGPHLWLVWWKATRAIEKRDRQSIKEQGFEGLSDFAVLEVLLHKGPQPVNTIGRRVMLTSGSITAAVDRAENKGYVERRASPTDRRVVEVHLTSAGQRHIANAYQQHAQVLEDIFGEFTSEERTTLYQLIKKVGLRAAALADS
ncbi:MarR family winged helix-turn-helix transcriptional regulator [Cerasicoccus arenae]|uniref:HTH-type transcriptional regulator MhqR n=1 Tax=Cerasicoccus arenae TaxID=424488 RepID=A0A8J3DJZ4_9BACT|nr:MarR family transcriptional regulator [Cerasicoccus arenae]MBK1858361.1 MarR family transcriptional regulator [Cerasicoccus arenae]GHC09815.1 HTH-type transcriptional regulator MhqR [Cerasicoccus arenae]